MNRRTFTVSVVLLFFCACSNTAREFQGELEDLRTIQARQTASLSQIQEELRLLSGQVEELQFHAMGKTAELEKSLQRLGSRVPPPSGVPEDLLTQDEEKIAKIAGEAADLYRQALRQMRTGAFAEAEHLLTEFISGNPQTAFTDNAYFWSGVSAERTGDYQKAVANYSTVFQKFPAEDRVAPALLRLGNVFAKLNSPDDARLAYQKLIDDFPRSSYATSAKKQLKKLRGKKKR